MKSPAIERGPHSRWLWEEMCILESLEHFQKILFSNTHYHLRILHVTSQKNKYHHFK